MEAYFPRKALAMRGGLFAPGGISCSTKSPYVEVYRLRSSEHLSVCQRLLSVATCFDKNTVWVHHNASGSDFKSVVLIRTFPGAQSRLICRDFARFVERFVVSTATVLRLTQNNWWSCLSHNWINKYPQN